MSAMTEKIKRRIEQLCDPCDFTYDVGDYDVAFGCPRYVPELTCPADFDPDDVACPLHDVYVSYKELLDEYENLPEGDDRECRFVII